MKLSRYGQRYSGQSGIIDLMQDLGSALRDNPQMLMMAGGTPARIPAAEQLFQHTLQLLLQDDGATFRLLGCQSAPKTFHLSASKTFQSSDLFRKCFVGETNGACEFRQ